MIEYATSYIWKINLEFWVSLDRSISYPIGLLLFRLGSSPPWRSNVGSLIRDYRRALILGFIIVRELIETLIWGLRLPLSMMFCLALGRMNLGFLHFFACP